MMYKIDAHNHPDFLGMSFQKLIANMDQFGIDKLCLMPWEESWTENILSGMGATPSPLSTDLVIPFERCLSFYERAPERFILCYAPDPRVPGAIYKMKSAIDTYGVKICGEFKLRVMLDNPDVIDLFRYCGERGVPVDLHLQNAEAHPGGSGTLFPHYWYGGDIFTLERTLQLCPDTNIMGHSTSFWGTISGDDLWKTKSYPRGPVVPGGHLERLLEKYPNLYCDCSGDSGLWALERDPEYTKKLLLTYPDRFIFARDGFTNQLSEFIDTLGLPQDVLENFYHRNIERLIGE